MSQNFTYKNDTLYCENVDIAAFAKTVPTPFIIYSKAEVEQNCKSVLKAGAHANYTACYALKANYNPKLLKLIAQNGLGADIVSGGELYFAEKAGFTKDKIVFAGVGKTDLELEEAIKKEVHSINVESPAELETINKIAQKLNKTQRIAIRINPDIDAKTHEYISTGLHKNKFGISTEAAFDLYLHSTGLKHVNADGIHVHIGSQITEGSAFLDTAAFLKEFVNRLAQKGITITYLDLGGGIGINYQTALTAEKSSMLETILPAYIKAFDGMDLKLYVELGRSIIGNAGALISKVILRKATPLKKFIIVDAAMNNLIRPCLYQAHHQIVPLQKNKHTQIKADIVGPICESSDFLAKDYEIEDMPAESYIAVGSAGAYAQSIASNYNLRPTIAEYLVDGDKVEQIYKGRSIADLANEYEW